MSNETKEIGKITSARFGAGGYQDSQFGLSLCFESKKNHWGVSSFICGGWRYDMTPDKYSKWSESDRSAQMAKMCKEIDELLAAALVDHINELVGIPVEVTFENQSIKSFRILEEVL